MKKFVLFLTISVLCLLVFPAKVSAIGYSNSAAELVIGQQGFNCQGGERQGDIVRSLYRVFNSALVVGTKLIIPAGNGNRITIYNTIPTENYPTPDLILGPNDPCVHPFYSSDPPNTFWNPSAAYFDGTRFYVVDTMDNRILIYNHGVPTSQSQGPDVVVGQPDFATITANTGGVSASTLNNPYDLWSDGTKMIVSDQLNNRILIWNSVPTTNGTPADVVIGQSDMVTTTSGTSSTNLSAPRGLDVYAGKLYVADQTNNRVLVYNSIPTTNNAAADLVIGQPDMNSKVVNNGGLSASTLNVPTDVNLKNGKMFIGDKANSRVLIYNTIPTTNKPNADVVVGQPDFVTNSAGLSASKFNFSYSGYSDGTRMYVTDYNNDRLLIYNSIPTTNGAAADVVVGQPDMTTDKTRYGQNPPAGDNFSWVNSVATNGTSIYIGDGLGNRVLKFNSLPTVNGATADIVIGQPDMTTVSAGTSAAKYPGSSSIAFSGSKMIATSGHRVLIYNSIPTTNGASADVVIGQSLMTTNTANNGGISAKSLYYPYGIEVAEEKLIVSDSSNHRILIYNSIPTSNFAAADVVIGQPDMISNTPNNGGISAASLNIPYEIEYSNGKLFIADSANNRVLVYNSLPTTNGASADLVIGQPNFTSNTANNGGISSRSLSKPYSIIIHNSTVYISDANNHRILIYNSIPTNSYPSADAVLGQTDMVHAQRGTTSAGLNYPSQIEIFSSKILVADRYNSRVLVYPTGPQNVSVTGGGLFNPTNASITLASDDAKEVIVSEDSGFAGATWSSFATTKSVTVSAGNGVKTLYVKMRDYANFESSVYTTTITIDDQKPSAAKITNIGMITNIPDTSPLYYYFTSQTALIQGTAEAGTTVHFKYETNDYTTIAKSDGTFSIEITNLPRELVEFTYYTQDSAGNISTSRILKLMIGYENFLDSLIPSVVEPESEIPDETATEIPTSHPTITLYNVLLKDQNDNILKNTTVYIDGEKYITDSNGKIYVNMSVLNNAKVEVEINGKRYKGGVLGETITVQMEETTLSSKKKNYNWIWITLGFIALVTYLVYRIRRRKLSSQN